ncbi:MAG: SDR family oxidoreductase [Chloroflexi bacterium]|nr:SDR family oxidoreductase [Chloroflexota bacterium]
MAGVLQDRAAIITGGSQGIGKAIARAFLAEGCGCLLVARTHSALEATAQELSAIGPPVIAFAADVGAPDEVSAAVRRARSDLGGVDILVNCAGVYGPIGPGADVDPYAWWGALRVNLFGTFLCTRAVLPHMLRRGRGKVINLAGGGASTPFPRFSAYAASKAAVVRLTETLAVELSGSGVDVNAIAPGPVNTRLLDQALAAGQAAGEEFLRRSQRQKAEGGTSPERAAELAVFLASPRSDGLSGRLISAVWDDWPQMAPRIPEIMASEQYTLRRVTDGTAVGGRP